MKALSVQILYKEQLQLVSGYQFAQSTLIPLPLLQISFCIAVFCVSRFCSDVLEILVRLDAGIISFFVAAKKSNLISLSTSETSMPPDI